MLLQRQTHSLRPLTTAHLAQTMTLLGLTVAELRQKIETELAQNPALELVEEHRCPVCHRPQPYGGVCPLCNRLPAATSEQPIVFLSPPEDFQHHGSMPREELPDDNLAPEVEDLPTFVLRQIAADLAPENRKLAAYILTNLDDDGLFDGSIQEIARYHHVLPSQIEEVLHVIQRSEPVGVGCRTPQEALLVQLDVLAETRPIPALAAAAIQQGMNLLSRRKYIELGQLLNISTSQASQIATFISDNLNPYPARAHWGDVHQSLESTPDVYHTPDVIITRLNELDNTPLVVEIITPLSGTLRVNPLFRQALHQAPPEHSAEWQQSIDRATLLVKCIGQRNHTLVRLLELLAVLQREFILHGELQLQPITRARIAIELEVHESTISRAVSDKAVQMPTGRIIPLSTFFDRNLQVRTVLKQIISQDLAANFSDSQLAEILKLQGYPVARRTVAKYRAMEGILPSHLRQPLKPC
jgi:RNA polymerase sigma-54 factor